MSFNPNVRANRVTSQIVTSNFFQGTNADITNITCDTLTTDIIISGTAVFNGDVKINSTTQSTSPTTGALVVVGGVGIGKNLNVQQNLGVTGFVNVYNSTQTPFNGTTGALGVSGGATIAKNLYVGGTGYINGNLGVTGNANINGTINNAYLKFNNGIYSINNVNTVSTGSNNTIYGFNTFLNNSTGSNNTVIGNSALQQNTTGNNTAIGSLAGQSLQTGTNNVFVGDSTGAYSITGSYNVIVGSSAGTTGPIGTTGSVCIGASAGNSTTNNYNTFIGHQSGYTGTVSNYGGTGNICIGAFSRPQTILQSNTVVLGNVSTNAYTTFDLTQSGNSWSNPSDIRDKTDIEIIPFGIDLINKIQPSRFKWDNRSWYENGISDGSKKQENWTPGFLAQQLDEVQNSSDAEYLNLVVKNDPSKLRITTGNLIPVMVKSIQDLSNLNNELIARIDVLENKINSLNL